MGIKTIDGLTKHRLEEASKRCAEACAAPGRAIMVIVLAAEVGGPIADGVMVSAWDQLSPGVAQGFGGMLHQAGYTLEAGAKTRNADVLKSGVSSGGILNG